ncbi:MAG: DUF1800 domain-containing protein [Planctomycetes bacterium]|nr:DUF1800 domain-containing protein [Planctomycetota bacterium]
MGIRASTLLLFVALAAVAIANEPTRPISGSNSGSNSHSAVERPATGRDATSIEWNARNAEHLLNRAGFGARPAEIAAAVNVGHAAFVEQLLTGFRPDYEPFFVERIERPDRDELQAMGEAERREFLNQVQRDNRRQLAQFAGWWVDQMLESHHPLRERMTLFWHGYFTSSARDVRSSAAMIEQNELFRTRGLGKFGELLRAIVRDPAMLEYLDNNQNRKGNPNENFAREVMELFTLGEGHYTEADIKEAARALTGWVTRRGEAAYVKGRHDNGKKTILGVTKNFDADSFLALLLEQPACPQWLAKKLLVHFEGRTPSPARIDDYASFLKSNDYDVRAFLRRLFLDPAFYSDDVVAARIASPIDYLVGTSRRLSVEPPPALLWLAAGQLGERLFEPPSVKGWDGGQAWITTSTLMQRGNMAGMLLGVVKLEDVLRPEVLDEEPEPGDMSGEMTGEMTGDEAGGDEMSGDDGESRRAPRAKPDAKPAKKKPATPALKGEYGQMGRMLADAYIPAIHLSARLQRAQATNDHAAVDALADELLPVALTPESRAELVRFLASEREALGIEEAQLCKSGRDGERLLRRLAHLILSLPEAQLS